MNCKSRLILVCLISLISLLIFTSSIAISQSENIRIKSDKFNEPSQFKPLSRETELKKFGNKTELNLSYQGFIVELKEEPVLEIRAKGLDRLKKLNKDWKKQPDWWKWSVGLLSTRTQEGLTKIDTLNKMNLQKNKITEEHRRFLSKIQRFAPKKDLTQPRYEYKRLSNGFFLNASLPQVAKIRNLPEVKTIYPNYRVKLFLQDSVPQIHAPKAWEGGYTGDGVQIAIVDTGVDYTHPDLGGCTKQEFLSGNCEKVVGGYDYGAKGGEFDPDPMDIHGHGTHVASTAAGKGDYNHNNRWDPGEYWGVAPDAEIYAYKVFPDATLKNIFKALDNIPEEVDVISMSIGIGLPNPDELPPWIEELPIGPKGLWSKKVNRLVRNGFVVTMAAGNAGSEKTIISPATSKLGIAVASLKKNDEISSFSSRGPVDLQGQEFIKPDIAAPGGDYDSSARCPYPNGIMAAASDVISDEFMKACGEVSHGVRHVKMSGTSMAAPHAAGVAALILDRHPDWSPLEVKAAIKTTAEDLGYSKTVQGAGKINAAGATSLKSPPPVAVINTSGEVESKINIEGIATSRNFKEYDLYISKGEFTDNFRKIHSSTKEVPDNGILLKNFNTENYEDGKWTLKLEVVDAKGKTSEDLSVINIRNVYLNINDFLTEPPVPSENFFRPNQLGVLKLKGKTIIKNFDHYDLTWKQTESDSWSDKYITLRNNGKKKINKGVLGTFDLSHLEKGKLYTLRLRVFSQDGKVKKSEKRIYLALNMPEKGWPVHPTRSCSAFSPLRLEDFNNDGKDEVLFINNDEFKLYNGEGGKIIDFSDPWLKWLESKSLNIVDLDNDGGKELLSDPKYELSAMDTKGNKVSLVNFRERVKEDFNRWYKAIYGKYEEAGGEYLTFQTLNKLITDDLNGDGKYEILSLFVYKPLPILEESLANPPENVFAYLTDSEGNTLSGWPKRFYIDQGSIFSAEYADATVGDLNGDGKKEIIISTIKGVHAFETSGKEINGWPVNIESRWGPQVYSADFNGDGLDEVLVFEGRRNDIEEKRGRCPKSESVCGGRLYIIDGKGRKIFTYLDESPGDLGIAIGDVKGDESPEIVVSHWVLESGKSELIIFDHKGEWNRFLMSNVEAAQATEKPILGDIDGDEKSEILVLPTFTTYKQGLYHNLYAYNADGSLVKNFPIVTIRPGAIGPVLGNIDEDKNIEGVWLNQNCSIYAFEVSKEVKNLPDSLDWPTPFHDARLTSHYPNTPKLREPSTNKKPRASFDFSPKNTETPQVITFDASSSYDPDGEIVSYEWDLSLETSDYIEGPYGAYKKLGKTPSKAYLRPGYHEVELKVTDNEGLSDTVTKSFILKENRFMRHGLEKYGSYWYMSRPMQSCEELCKGSKCVQPEWNKVPEDCSLFNLMGVKCSSCSSVDYPFAPYFDVNDEKFECFPKKKNSGDYSCSEKFSTRLCACESKVEKEEPVAQFTFKPGQPKVWEKITFDASESYDPEGFISKYRWDLNDDGIPDKEGKEITHKFNNFGRYNVTLIVEDNEGFKNEITKLVKVTDYNFDLAPEAPVPRFSIKPKNPRINEEIEFDASSSLDYQGEIKEYKWDFDNDGVIDKTGKIVTHIYASGGVFEAKLTVIDNDGLKNSKIRKVEVKSVQGARCGPESRGLKLYGSCWYIGGKGESCTEVCKNYGGKCVQADWHSISENEYCKLCTKLSEVRKCEGTVNDRAPMIWIDQKRCFYPDMSWYGKSYHERFKYSCGRSPIFSEERRICACGFEGIGKKKIPPVASFTFTPEKPKQNEEITFNASNSYARDGSIVKYGWDFDGDGKTDKIGKIVTYSWSKEGDYEVTLTVEDDDGKKDSKSEIITIYKIKKQKPIVSFTFSPKKPKQNKIITFDASNSKDEDGHIIKYEWDFNNDGITDKKGEVVKYAYETSGVFEINLTVTDNDGLKNWKVKEIEVKKEITETCGPNNQGLKLNQSCWYLGEKGKSCDEVCNNYKGKCIQAEWDKINGNDYCNLCKKLTGNELELCKWTVETYLNPYLADNKCFYSKEGEEGYECDSSWKDGSRICACSFEEKKQEPQPSFTFTPLKPTQNQEITFDASNSKDEDGTIEEYRWDINNDGKVDKKGKVIKYIYQSPRFYTINLTVIDNDNLKDSITKRIKVFEGCKGTKALTCQTPPLEDSDERRWINKKCERDSIQIQCGDKYHYLCDVNGECSQIEPSISSYSLNKEEIKTGDSFSISVNGNCPSNLPGKCLIECRIKGPEGRLIELDTWDEDGKTELSFKTKKSGFYTVKYCGVFTDFFRNSGWGKDISEEKTIKSVSTDLHLAFHPTCKEGKKIVYEIGKSLKEELEGVVKEFRMRDKIECEFKQDGTPKDFPFWVGKPEKNYLTISLKQSELNKIFYIKGSKYGKKLAFNLTRNLIENNFSPKPSPRGVQCPEYTDLCENSYGGTPISVRIDFNKNDVEDIANTIEDSLKSFVKSLSNS